MNFLYLISSHRKYKEPLERLLRSMSYINPERKFVAIGGCDDRHMAVNLGALTLNVEHNSFDYTALIEVLEHPPVGFSHVFLLHDTMEISPETDALIDRADPTMDAVAAYPGGQCNLCLFRTDWLMRNRDRILAMRNCTKDEAVKFEGVLFKDAPRQAVFPNAECRVLSEAPVYEGGLKRRTELYTSVQILKFKSSWGQEMERMHERVKP